MSLALACWIGVLALGGGGDDLVVLKDGQELHGRVVFEEASTSVEVEVAETYEQRKRGLMYRKSMGEEEGMLFVFDEESVHRFWMRNTCIPLDMLFIADDGLIVGIAENAPTLNDDGYLVPCPSVYVLEVNAGWSRRHGVKPGQKVKLEK